MSRATLTARQGLRTDGTVTAAPTHAASTPWTIACLRSWAGTVIETARLTAGVAMLALAGVLLVAALVDVALAGQARTWLRYGFRGLPARPNVAVVIFVHNARAILGAFGLLLSPSSRRAARTGPRAPSG